MIKHPTKLVKKLSLPNVLKEVKQKKKVKIATLLPKSLKKAPSKTKRGGKFSGRYD